MLRRGDQLLIALIMALAVTSGTIYFGVQRMRSVEYLDVDDATAPNYQFLVDLNQADWPELAQLPGIGETLARRIVESREAKGPFIDHSDLQRVRGIGPRTVENLREFFVPMPQAGTIASDASVDPAS